jgi:hypothetical protein
MSYAEIFTLMSILTFIFTLYLEDEGEKHWREDRGNP